MLTTVFMDVDHVFDQVVENRRFDSLYRMIKVYKNSSMKIVIMFFHSWELVVALAALAFMTSDVITGAIAAGLGFHLLLDNVYYTLIKPRVKLFMYLFSYRIYNGFKASKLIVNTPSKNIPTIE